MVLTWKQRVKTAITLLVSVMCIGGASNTLYAAEDAPTKSEKEKKKRKVSKKEKEEDQEAEKPKVPEKKTKRKASNTILRSLKEQRQDDFAVRHLKGKEKDGFGLQLSGFLQTGYRWTMNDPQFLRLGESDGFFLRRARIRMDSQWWKFRAVITIDGALDPRADPMSVSPAQRRFDVAVRDAFLKFVHEGFFVSIGQMRVAFGGLNQISTANQHFGTFPLIDAGEDISFGYPARGIIPGRDIGLSVGYDNRFGLVGIHARAMVYNGNGERRFGNDSDLPAVATRLALDIGPESFQVKVGGSFLWNSRRVGEEPNLYDEVDLAFGGDLGVYFSGFFLEGEFAGRTTSFPTVNQPNAFSYGFRADVGYRIPGINLEPVVRFELFDPSDQFNNDQLIYITIGLNWYFTFWKDHELILRASYTIKMEETPDRTLNNDQFNFLLQYRL
ncbi:MAG: hypothetical protein H6727_10410 [Myxococcales bacterium]|nr:hypothetical protein [Myxococcales bacterium]